MGLLTYANAWFNADKNDFFETSKRGWHYFEKDKENNKTKLVKQKKQKDKEDEVFMSSIPINNLDLLTAKQFTETFERARQIAVMKPTKQNVAIVQKMNKFQTERSEIFAKTWEINILENPNLEFPDIASTSFGQSQAHNEKKAKINKFYEQHKNDLGYVVFFSAVNGQTNEKQKAVYDYLHKTYGVEVQFIDIDERKDLIQPLNLTTTPENFFAYKNSNDEVILKRIKAGLITQDEVVSNTMFLFENAILEKDK